MRFTRIILRILLLTFSALMAIAAIGGLASGDFKTALICAVLSAGSIYFFIYRMRAYKQRIAAITAKNEQIAADLSTKVASIEKNGPQTLTTENLILRGNELALYEAEGGLYEMRVDSASTRNAGVRVRVAKGVSVNLGGGKITPDKELKRIANGHLIVTNTRIVFAGDAKSFDAPLNKIINIKYFDDGASIHVDSRQNPYMVVVDDGTTQVLKSVVQYVFKQKEVA